MDKKLKLCILGDGYVGKSSIKLRYFSNKFKENTIPTILDSIESKKKYKDKIIDLIVYDTSGQEEYEVVAYNNISKCNYFILVFAINSRNSLDHLYIILDEITRIKKSSFYEIYLVGNKSDLNSQREISLVELERISKKWNCTYIETSAKYDVNIDELFNKIFESFINKTDIIIEKKRKKFCSLL